MGALHLVSLRASAFGLCLTQMATDEKSNEITAIPMVLKQVDIQGAIIIINAMGTRTAIGADIVSRGADYVLALKGNRGTLQDATIAYVDEQTRSDFAQIGAPRHVVQQKGHGRTETRHYVRMPLPADSPGVKRSKGLKTSGVAMLHALREGGRHLKQYLISSAVKPSSKFPDDFKAARRGT